MNCLVNLYQLVWYNQSFVPLSHRRSTKVSLETRDPSRWTAQEFKQVNIAPISLLPLFLSWRLAGQNSRLLCEWSKAQRARKADRAAIICSILATLCFLQEIQDRSTFRTVVFMGSKTVTYIHTYFIYSYTVKPSVYIYNKSFYYNYTVLKDCCVEAQPGATI